MVRSFALILLFLCSSAPLLAQAVIKMKPVNATNRFTLEHRGASYQCGRVGSKFVLLHALKGIRVTTLDQRIKFLADSLRNGSLPKKQLARFRTERSRLLGAKKALGPVCARGLVATPDHLSLAPVAGPLSREQVQLMLEKACYGLSLADEPVVSAGATSARAAVEEALRIKSEPPGLLDRVRDRYDNNTLGNLATQSRNNFNAAGFRRAELDLAVNTANPCRNNLKHFLFSMWTVGDDELNNNTQNNPQFPLLLDYWGLLEETAFNPNLPDQLIKVGRHPLMLWYLDNDQNLLGNVNENYGRELMELFSIGTERIENGVSVPNYVEDRGGNRTRGDVYRLSRVLTGWRVSPLMGGDGLMYWRSVYSAADHDPEPQLLFEGTPHAFVASSDEEVVRGIFARHPGAPQFVARELLEWYLTPNPPIELVNALGAVIKANNFNLEEPLRVLFSSRAFYNPRYRDTVSKSSFKATVELIRIMELARGGGAEVSGQPVGVNVASIDNRLVNMAYVTNRPPTVFWFPKDTWRSPTTLLEFFEMGADVVFDTTVRDRLYGTYNQASWPLPPVLPPVPPQTPTAGEVREVDVIQWVASRLGITLNQDQILQLQFFMNYTRNANGSPTEFTRSPYNHHSADNRRDRGLVLYFMLAAHPQFLNG